MSTLDVVAEILREVAPRALKAREIAMRSEGRLPTASKTPETVVSRDLAIDVRDRGASSRFLRVDRGAFVLKEALPTAFYNEFEPYPAAWIRNLATAGEVAPGVVDERSIRDIRPVDVASYRQCHFFAGIAVWSRALRDAGWSDSDPIHSGSPPCQPFSSAGKRGGEADDRHLWPEWFRLIRACGPPIVVGEQVASKDGYRWLDGVASDFESIGYNFTATELSAAAVGAPHKRQRIYFVAFLGGRASSIVSSRSLPGVVAAPSGSGLHALQPRVEDEAHATRTGGDRDRVDIETARGPDSVAHAREGGREILSAPRLHDRRERGDDAVGCSTVDGGAACDVSDTAGARPCESKDDRADRGDAGTGAEEIDRWAAGDLEPERGRDADEACGLSDAERVMWDAGRQCRSHGRTQIQPDRHGEVDGAGDVGTDGLVDAGLAGLQGGVSGSCGRDGAVGAGEARGTCVGACIGAVELGDACVPRGWRDPGAVSRAQEAGEGERIEAGHLADELVAPGADDGASVGDEEVVRGAAGDPGDGGSGSYGFRPGDRIRLDGDPTWGGAVGGFWADDVEWIYCRPEPGHKDGRWRPVVAGVEPLVAGTSPELGRTRSARLRGYGNSIVRSVAKSFIEAVIETLIARSSTPKTCAMKVEDLEIVPTVEALEVPAAWTGPLEGETAPSGLLFARVPGDRWPYGPPTAHEPACNLFPHRGSPGGLFCDCAASAADDVASGVGA